MRRKGGREGGRDKVYVVHSFSSDITGHAVNSLLLKMTFGPVQVVSKT